MFDTPDHLSTTKADKLQTNGNERKWTAFYLHETHLRLRSLVAVVGSNYATVMTGY
jgi:hypothetical protein